MLIFLASFQIRKIIYFYFVDCSSYHRYLASTFFRTAFFFIDLLSFFEDNFSFYALIVSFRFAFSVSSCIIKCLRYNQQLKIFRSFLRDLEQKLIQIFGLAQGLRFTKWAHYFFLTLNNFRLWLIFKTGRAGFLW